MKSLILLIRGSVVIKAFTDWDWAELQLIRINEHVVKSNSNNFQSSINFIGKLVEVPFEGSAEVISEFVEVARNGEELIFLCYNSEDEVFGKIELAPYLEEQLIHESIPPEEIPTYQISKITVCGVELNKLKITRELKNVIEHEAEAYRDEMIANIGKLD